MGPDLCKGIALSTVALLRMANQPILVRRSDELFAVGAVWTHYGASLVDGLLVDDNLAVKGDWNRR